MSDARRKATRRWCSFCSSRWTRSSSRGRRQVTTIAAEADLTVLSVTRDSLGNYRRGHGGRLSGDPAQRRAAHAALVCVSSLCYFSHLASTCFQGTHVVLKKTLREHLGRPQACYLDRLLPACRLRSARNKYRCTSPMKPERRTCHAAILWACRTTGWPLVALPWGLTRSPLEALHYQAPSGRP